MSELGRQPLTIVELDRDQCTLRYGVLPCRAAFASGELRTNFALYSQTFGNAVWAVGTPRSTTVDNATAAPDGTTTAASWIEDGTAGIRTKPQTISFTSGLVYTLSFYAKRASGVRFPALSLPSAAFGTARFGGFDLDAVTASFAGGSGAALIEALANGWFRCQITATASATASGAVVLRMADVATAATISYSGDGTSGLYVWGAQLETGDPASTYKATTAAAVTELWGTGQRKCYNTFATCGDTANYDRGNIVLRFAYNQSGLPKTGTIYPALKSVSTRAAEINLSGIDPKTTALGKRARVTVTLDEFGDNDTYVDPYQEERITGEAQLDGIGYDPSRGLFFAKELARSPYYVGRGLRIKRGYVGDDVASMPAAHYVVSERAGPTSDGTVTITAKDVLDLADNAKAVAPAASNGKLVSDIAIDAAAFILTPTGAGAEYPASGRVCIGREVMTFTRSGDVMTITARGVDGTTAAAHTTNDVVQLCLRYEAMTGAEIFADLEENYAGIDPAFIDLATWSADAARWMGGITFTRTITKPTGVSLLIGQICQHGIMHWWDELQQELMFRPNRPLDLGEAYFPVTDAANLIEGTVASEEGDDQRISALFFYHGQIDPTDGDESARNYSKLAIALDPSASSANEYGEERIKYIYSPWLGQAGDDPAALAISTRLLNRYRNTPRIIAGMLDVKDRASVGLGSLLSVQSYLFQDATGLASPQLMQVNYAEEKEDRISFKAETYTFRGRYCFITDNARGDYGAASDAEKAKGTYIVDSTTLMFADGTGPYVMF